MKDLEFCANLPFGRFLWNLDCGEFKRETGSRVRLDGERKHFRVQTWVWSLRGDPSLPLCYNPNPQVEAS